MRKTAGFFLMACLVLSLAACGYKEGIVQSSPESYIKFTGNTLDAFATIDDGAPFPLWSTGDNGKPVIYRLSPGKHRITVERNNNVVLDREVLIGNGMTKEINLR